MTTVKAAKGKGFFKPEATAMVREVLTNELSDAKAAARLGVLLKKIGLQNPRFLLRRSETGEGCQLADHAPLQAAYKAVLHPLCNRV